MVMGDQRSIEQRWEEEAREQQTQEEEKKICCCFTHFITHARSRATSRRHLMLVGIITAAKGPYTLSRWRNDLSLLAGNN